MGKQVAIRRVRIAVSVFFGVLTVALCVLWVRSYETCDVLRVWRDKVLAVSVEGHACILIPYKDNYQAQGHLISVPAETVSLRSEILGLRSIRSEVVGLRSGYFRSGIFYFKAAYWLLVSLILPLGIFPWVPWSRRYGFRTLTIAATYLSVVLGALRLCIVVK